MALLVGPVSIAAIPAISVGFLREDGDDGF
jgi:hypothetical protein